LHLPISNNNWLNHAFDPTRTSEKHIISYGFGIFYSQYVFYAGGKGWVTVSETELPWRYITEIMSEIVVFEALFGPMAGHHQWHAGPEWLHLWIYLIGHYHISVRNVGYFPNFSLSLRYRREAFPLFHYKIRDLKIGVRYRPFGNKFPVPFITDNLFNIKSLFFNAAMYGYLMVCLYFTRTFICCVVHVKIVLYFWVYNYRCRQISGFIHKVWV